MAARTLAVYGSGLEKLYTSRRAFLRRYAPAPVIALASQSPSLGEVPVPQEAPIPSRKLGRTRVEVSILGQEASRSHGSLVRLLRSAYAKGVRSFDTADCYASSESSIADWLHAKPEIRNSVFLTTKDHPRDPSQMMGMVERRLAALRTDYVDLFLIHSLGSIQTLDEALALVKSPELKSAIAAIKRSGKARFVGFSTEHHDRAQIVEAAAEVGFIDAIMLQFNAWLEKNTRLDKALDSAFERGIGLIAMKPLAGFNRVSLLEEFSRQRPDLTERGLTPFQGILHAVWSDERIASCSVSLRNTEELNECVEAARRFKSD